LKPAVAPTRFQFERLELGGHVFSCLVVTRFAAHPAFASVVSKKIQMGLEILPVDCGEAAVNGIGGRGQGGLARRFIRRIATSGNARTQNR
jgi:hypothetical protein